jgi:hypothetical protein
MDILKTLKTTIKRILGFCTYKGCRKRGVFDVTFPTATKICLCEEHLHLLTQNAKSVTVYEED